MKKRLELILLEKVAHILYCLNEISLLLHISNYLLFKTIFDNWAGFDKTGSLWEEVGYEEMYQWLC